MNLQSNCPVCLQYQRAYIDPEDNYTELETCEICHHLFLPYVADCMCGLHEKVHDEPASEKGQRPE